MNNRLLAALSIKPFFFLLMAEVFAQLAINMLNFILIVVAFELSNSNTAVSGIVLSFTIPAIIFGIIAGVYVDKHDKKRILLGANLIRGFLLLLLVVFRTNLFVIFIISFIVSVVTQFFIPAETPIIPLVVRKKLLITANALFGVGIFGSILAAYALSGPFLLYFGRHYVFIVLAMLFFIAAFFASFIKIPNIDRNKEKKLEIYHSEMSFKEEMRRLFKLMVNTKEIYHSLFLLTISQVIILIMAVIGPGYAIQILGLSVDKFPIFFVTPAALGLLIGALVVGNFFYAKSKRTLANIGVFLSGIAIILLPYGSKVTSRGFIHELNLYLPAIITIDILHIMMFLAFLLGLANAFVFVPSNTLLQEKTTDEYRGKMYGVLNAFVGIFSLIPIIIVGEFSDLFGVAKVLTGIGLVLLMLAGLRISIFR